MMAGIDLFSSDNCRLYVASPLLIASVAQLAEHALRKRMVRGSIPLRG